MLLYFLQNKITIFIIQPHTLNFGSQINTMQEQIVNLCTQSIFTLNLFYGLFIGFDGGIMRNKSRRNKSWLCITQWGWIAQCKILLIRD